MEREMRLVTPPCAARTDRRFKAKGYIYLLLCNTQCFNRMILEKCWCTQHQAYIFIFNKERADNRKDSAAAANRRLVIKPFTSQRAVLMRAAAREREESELIACFWVCFYLEMRAAREVCVRPIVLISHACACEINANQAVRPAHFIYIYIHIATVWEVLQKKQTSCYGHGQCTMQSRVFAFACLVVLPACFWAGLRSDFPSC